MTSVLPYNQDAEDHTIGACLLSERALERVTELLQPQHFYARRRIYETIVALHDAGEPAEAVLVMQQLEREGRSQDVETLRRIISLHPTAANAEHFARVVHELATRRQLVTIGQEIARSGYEPSGSITDELEKAERLVYDLTTQHEPGELRAIRETLNHTYEQLERPGGEITGTPTGLAKLDQLTAGLQPGNLVVIAARPGMGKSSLALQIAHHNAIRRAAGAAVFSLEMSAEEINQRLLALQTTVGLMNIRTRNGLTPEHRQQLNAARPSLERAPLYVDDTVSARLTDIRARSRRLKSKQQDISVVVVDYIQLMLTDKAENRNLEVAALSRGLKLLARELNVPVIALAQLNRKVEERADKTPMLADLRDSGAIEQDADLVMFIHRKDEDGQEGSTATITVAKHRNGPTGAVNVAWLKRRATFGELA